MKQILILSLAAISLAACTKPSDNGGNGDDSEKYTYTVTYYAGESGYDNLLFYDLKVTYKDADGQNVEVPVTEYPFKVTFTLSEAPFTAEITPVYTMKALEDIDSGKETFRLCSDRMHISYVRSDKQSSSTDSGWSHQTLPLEKAYEYISRQVEKLNGKTVSLEVQ